MSRAGRIPERRHRTARDPDSDREHAAALPGGNALTTSGSVNVSGQATYQVLNTYGTSITLMPGFTAVASSSTTFKALIGQLAPSQPPTVTDTSQIGVPQTAVFTFLNTLNPFPIEGGQILFTATGSSDQCPMEFWTSDLSVGLIPGASNVTCRINSYTVSVGSEVVTVTLNLTFSNADDFTITDMPINSDGTQQPVFGLNTWTVTALPPPQITSSSPLPNATEMVQYNQTLRATGGVSPYNWAASGSLPTWLSLTSQGQLSGTPNLAGVYSFAAEVTDSAGASATQNFSLTVPISVTAAPLNLLPSSFASSGYPFPLCGVNCVGVTSYIYYTTSNNSLSGLSTTVLEGPDSLNYATSALAYMTTSAGTLGNQCANSTPGTPYLNDGYYYQEADSRSPLDLPRFLRQTVKSQISLNGELTLWDCLEGSSPRK